MKVLFVGESWGVIETHIKGFDVVDLGRIELDWANDVFKAIKECGFEMVRLQSQVAQNNFPETLDELQQYDVIILSDIGSNTLLLDSEMMFKGVKKPNRLKLLVEYVKQGGGLIMFGGYLSFSGIGNKARYGMTPLAEVLPVTMLNYDDRIETPEGAFPTILLKDHPVMNGIEGDWPAHLGYNRIKAKPEAQEIAVIEGSDTFMAAMECGQGRTFAFAADCVGHWSYDMTQWEHYNTLISNIIRWTAKEI